MKLHANGNKKRKTGEQTKKSDIVSDAPRSYLQLIPKIDSLEFIPIVFRFFWPALSASRSLCAR